MNVKHTIKFPMSEKSSQFEDQEKKLTRITKEFFKDKENQKIVNLVTAKINL